MALKGNRQIKLTRVDIYCDQVIEKGGVLVFNTAGSGNTLDQAQNLGEYAVTSSGKHVIGFALDNVVDTDLTRYKLNQHKDEIYKGGKVSVATVGYVLTNMYVGSPVLGKAYLSSSGKLTPTWINDAATPLVGRFEGSPDEDGYVKVSFNLP